MCAKRATTQKYVTVDNWDIVPPANGIPGSDREDLETAQGMIFDPVLLSRSVLNDLLPLEANRGYIMPELRDKYSSIGESGKTLSVETDGYYRDKVKRGLITPPPKKEIYRGPRTAAELEATIDELKTVIANSPKAEDQTEIIVLQGMVDQLTQQLEGLNRTASEHST